MGAEFLYAAILLLPIILANQGPGIARALRLPGSRTPVSRRWLGENKTVAAYYAGPLLTIPGMLLLQEPQWIWGSMLIGLCTVLGDHVKSFFKRRLGIAPGAPWIFDRFDFVVGGWVGWSLFWGALAPWWLLFWMTIIAIPIHIVGNHVSYKLGLRKTPH